MHPRNRYNVKPDFSELAKFHPPLEPYLIRKKSKFTIDSEEPTPSKKEGVSLGESPTEKRFPFMLDFSNPLALRELTLAVMAKDFGLDIVIPVDKLIPAVPQRLNYIHWVEDLLNLCEGGNETETSCGNGMGTKHGNRMKANNIEDGNVKNVSDSSTIGIDIGNNTFFSYIIYCIKS